MNRNGQVLIFFVIFIPILIGVVALVIDIGYSYNQLNKLNNINRMIIKYGLNNLNDDDISSKMIDLIQKNDDIDSYTLNIKNNQITLTLNKNIDSIFGNVLNIKVYNLSSTYKGYIKNNKFVIEKG